MRLTNSEKLLLHRRRAGLSQSAQAEALGLGLKQYVSFESGQREPSDVLPIGRVGDHEWCFIRRRRARVKQKVLAHRLGRSRRWVMLMETGRAPCQELVDYWHNVL